MARSTYISENLNQQQIDFMLLLDDYELDIFTLDELKKQFSQQFIDINELVENLVHKKILSRIERGKYCRANFNDEKVIAKKGLLIENLQLVLSMLLGHCREFNGEQSINNVLLFFYHKSSPLSMNSKGFKVVNFPYRPFAGAFIKM
jgi:hypothetical protein